MFHHKNKARTKSGPKKPGQSSSHGTIFQSFRHAKTFPTEAEKQVAPASVRTCPYGITAEKSTGWAQ